MRVLDSLMHWHIDNTFAIIGFTSIIQLEYISTIV